MDAYNKVHTYNYDFGGGFVEFMHKSRTLAEAFREVGVDHLHYMAPCATMPLIAKWGILSYSKRLIFEQNPEAHSMMLECRSISDPNVQSRRKHIKVGGKSLHEYAPLYFGIHTPMQYVVSRDNVEIAFVEVDLDRVCAIDGIYYTDGNAASAVTSFFQDKDGIDKIEWDIVLFEDVCYSREYKRIKCAEMLVPCSVPPECILRFKFRTEEATDRFREQIDRLEHDGFINDGLSFEVVCDESHF